MNTLGKHPNAFYRVSVKALVRDARGYVLVCKERSTKWELPGGGLDHGEEPLDGLRRELREELGIQSARIASAMPVEVLTVYRADKESWLMWVVYNVTLDAAKLQPGPDVSEIAFVDPSVLTKDSGWEAQFIAKALDAVSR